MLHDLAAHFIQVLDLSNVSSEAEHAESLESRRLGIGIGLRKSRGSWKEALVLAKAMTQFSDEVFNNICSWIESSGLIGSWDWVQIVRVWIQSKLSTKRFVGQRHRRAV